MVRFFRFILNYPKTVILFWVLALAFCMSRLPGIGIENSFQVLIKANVSEEVAAAFDETTKTFGTDRLIQIGLLPHQSIFEPEFLRWVDQTTRTIENWEHVEGITSLTNVSVIEGNEDELNIGPLIDELPETEAEAEAIAQRAQRSKLLERYLVGEDAQSTAITIDVAVYPEGDSEDYMRELVKRVRDLVSQRFVQGEEFFMSGGPVLAEGMYAGSMRDLKINTIGPAILIVLTLLILFRNVTAIVLPNLVVWASTTIVLGLAALYEPKLNILTLMLPVLIMTIAIADVIHILVHYYEELESGRERAEAVSRTVGAMTLPCFLTSLTTAIGFGSFMMAPMPLLRHFGLESAVGVLLVFFVAISLIPAILTLLPVPKIDLTFFHKRGAVSALLQRSGRWVGQRSGVIFLVAIALAGISIDGLTKLTFETSFREYFSDESQVKRAFAFNDRHLMGSAPLVVKLTGAPGAFKKPANLKAADAILRQAQQNPYVRKTIGLPDYVKELNRVFEGGDPNAYAIPDEADKVAGLLFLAENAGDSIALEKMVNWDYSQLRLNAMCVEVNTDRVQALMDDLQAFMDANLPPELKAEVTGTMAVAITMAGDLMRAQLTSIFGAVVLISIVLIIFMGGLRSGLLSVAPNFLPVVTALGIMGFVGVSLNISTVMIASIALGIAVDDTIHFLTRFRREFAKDGDYLAAAERSLYSIGRAMVFTSMVLSGGFIIVVFSHMKPPQHFGIFTSLAILIALACDLWLLPAVLTRFRPPMRASWMIGDGEE